MLVARVDDAVRMVGVVELDDVVARDVCGAGELHPQRLVEPGPQSLAP